MEIRFQNSPKETAAMHTDELRQHFVCEALMQDDKLNLVYSHYDRVIIGGAKPVNTTILLENEEELKADYFLQRREMGIINIGGPGKVLAGEATYDLQKLDCLYLGKETKDVKFQSLDAADPALFYILSAPAHHIYPTVKMSREEASPVNLGTVETSNQRTIYKYIHLDGIKSCQLVMGLTVLQTGSVWNSVPPHTHTRRMEVYYYFDLPENHVVFHFMGEPKETRHVVLTNNQAVISAPWSVHFGSGTSNYGFIWGMAGENQAFPDMDATPVHTLR